MTTWRLKSRLTLLGLMLGVFAFAVGCGDSSGDDDDDMMMGDDDDDMMMGDDDDDDDDDMVDMASVRAVHLAPNAGVVDIYDLAGETRTPVATEVGYLDVVGPAMVPVGSTVEVYATGADPDADDPVVTVSAPRTAGANATIAVRIGPADQVVAQSFDDSRIPEPEDPLIDVMARFVNATAPNSGVGPDIDLNTVIDSESTLQAGATSDIEFGQNQGLIGILGPAPQAAFRGAFDLRQLDLDAGERAYLFIAGDAEQGRLVQEGIALVYVGVTEQDSNEALRPETLPAWVRVLHLSPNAPPVDVYGLNPREEDEPIIDDLAFGQASPYLEDVDIDSGFEVYLGDAVIGGDGVEPLFVINAEGEDILEENISPFRDDETRHTIVVSGDASEEPVEGTELRWELFVDRADPAEGTFRARVYHASLDAPPVKLDVDGDGTPDTPEALAFTDTFAGDVVSPARLTVFGEDDSRITSLTIPAGTIPRGSVGYVAILGDPTLHPSEDESLAVLASSTRADNRGNQDQPLFFQDPMLWVFHGVPDAAAPVDVIINPGGAELAVPGVSFGDLSTRIQVSPGDLSFEVRAGDTPVSSDDTLFPVEDGERYLVAAVGLAAPDMDADPEMSDIRFLVLGDGFLRNNEESAQVRGVHASPDAFDVNVGTVTVGTPDAISVISGFGALSFGTASAPSGEALGPVLSPDTINLGVISTEAEDTVPAVVFEGVTGLLPGGRLFAIVAGEVVPESVETQPLTLFFIETGMGPWTVGEGILGRAGTPPD